MESKYKERAIKILNKELGEDQLNAGITGEIIDAMCELAEEVEKEYKEKTLYNYLNCIKENNKTLYTKEQVEELL